MSGTSSTPGAGDGIPGEARWRLIDASRMLMRLAAPITLFPLMFWAQIRFGPDISLFPLHMIAVAQLSWEFGRRGALLGVLAASALWLWGGLAGGWHYDSEWIRYYNAAARALAYGLIAAVVLVLHETIAMHRVRMARMRALLEVCSGCGAIRGSDGAWLSPSALAQRASQEQRAGQCTACANRRPVTPSDA